VIRGLVGEFGVDSGGPAADTVDVGAEFGEFAGIGVDDPAVRVPGFLPSGDASLVQPLANGAGGHAEFGREQWQPPLVFPRCVVGVGGQGPAPVGDRRSGAFLNHLENDRGNSVRTRNARLAAIHSLFGYAAVRHPEHAADIQRVLAIPPKRYGKALITYLTEDEITALLAAPDLATWTGRRDQSLLPAVSRIRWASFRAPPSAPKRLPEKDIKNCERGPNAWGPRRETPSTAAALGALSWAKVPGRG